MARRYSSIFPMMAGMEKPGRPYGLKSSLSVLRLANDNSFFIEYILLSIPTYWPQKLDFRHLPYNPQEEIKSDHLGCGNQSIDAILVNCTSLHRR